MCFKCLSTFQNIPQFPSIPILILPRLSTRLPLRPLIYFSHSCFLVIIIFACIGYSLNYTGLMSFSFNSFTYPPVCLPILNSFQQARLFFLFLGSVIFKHENLIFYYMNKITSYHNLSFPCRESLSAKVFVLLIRLQTWWAPSMQVCRYVRTCLAVCNKVSMVVWTWILMFRPISFISRCCFCAGKVRF